jgi:hypothetical protein
MYLMALAEGFISMAVFAYSAAAAAKPKPSNFKILYDL